MDYIWNITGKCNLQCQYCWDIFKNTDELDTNQAKKIIDQISAISCDMLLFTGGEPLIRNDLFELINYSHQKGIQHIKLCTNGLLLGKKIEEIRNASISEIHISLDGIVATDNEFRKENQAVLENLEILLQHIDLAKTKVVLVSVIDYNKIGKFEQVLQYAEEHGIYATYQLPTLSGIRKLSLHIDDMQSEKLKNLFDNLENFHQKYPKQLDYFSKFYLLAAKKYYLDKRIPDKCQAGVKFQIISPRGDFYPCYSTKHIEAKNHDCFESKCLVWFRSNNRAHKILDLLNTK